MLFWAVDNPAPANYLLISGDRDFSNALHQLRMRRYNILLAQPLQASAALAAAAKSVWRWTTLVAGGSPLTPAELSNISRHDSSPTLVSDSVSAHPFSYSHSNTSAWGDHHKFVGPGKRPDAEATPKFVIKTASQLCISRASSMPVGIHENISADYSKQLESAQEIQFKKAPHEFFGASSDSLSSSRAASNLFPGNQNPSSDVSNNFNNQLTQPQCAFHQDNLFPPTSTGDAFLPCPLRPDAPRNTVTSFAMPTDICKLNALEYPSYSKNAANSNQQRGKDFRFNSVESSSLVSSYGAHSGITLRASRPTYYSSPDNKYNQHPASPSPTSSSVTPRATPSNGVWGNEGCQPPSEYVQGLIGVIILALNTLKVEKVIPNEANITSCIRYGNPKFRHINVRKAMDFALEQQMIVKQNLGDMQLYVGRLERLWNCVNPIDSNMRQYPKLMWDMIQHFLASSSGRLALMNSESRYEAALILKSACLKELSLGEVLQVLYMIINIKRWIIVAQSGWQPITVTLPENHVDKGCKGLA